MLTECWNSYPEYNDDNNRAIAGAFLQHPQKLSQKHGRAYDIPPKYPWEQGQAIESDRVVSLRRAADMANRAAGVALYQVVVPEVQTMLGHGSLTAQGIMLYEAGTSEAHDALEPESIQDGYTRFQLMGDWRGMNGIHAGPVWDALYMLETNAGALEASSPTLVRQ